MYVSAAEVDKQTHLAKTAFKLCIVIEIYKHKNQVNNIWTNPSIKYIEYKYY